MPLRSSSPMSTSDDDSIAPGMSQMNYDPMDPADDANAIPPSSPASITTDNDDSPLTPDEERIQALCALQRRPGLGVIEDEIPPRSEAGPPSAEEAKILLGYDERKLKAELVAGEKVYFLEIDFYKQLIKWLDNEDDNLCPSQRACVDKNVDFWKGGVDNKQLFEYYENFSRPGRMRMALHNDFDFVFVNHKTWNYLMDWFGGGPCVMRKCVNLDQKAVVDIRGIELKIKRSSRPTKFIRHVFSVYDSIGVMKRAVIEDWKRCLDGFEVGTYRIWDYYEDKCLQRMHPESSLLHSFRLHEGQSIMFEEADPVTGEFKWDPEHGEEVPQHNLYSNSSYFDTRRRKPENSIVSTHPPVVSGAVGLSNLGNTCFMNSTLQCLSNIWLLRNKFLTDEYRNDINEKNVLGTGGKLANSFGDLMKLLWNNKGDVVSPQGFKSVMAEFKPEFSGYQQHDSQELLSFLLDGLHEDLNRVKQKPVTEPVEANGRSDEEVATDSCRVHHLRNDSLVNDLFEGFYKSTVVCPDCRKVSVTFDPFTMVQLPVSRPKQAKMLSFPVAVVSSSNGLPYRTRPAVIKVPQEYYAREVKVKACATERADAHPDDFIMCRVNHDRIDRVYNDADKQEKYYGGYPDEFILFEDPNARKWRMMKELHANKKWYRPIIDEEDYDFLKDFAINEPLEGSTGSIVACPFAEGDIWIGSLDAKGFRMRMQVKRVAPGPWAKGLGYQIHGVLDIGVSENDTRRPLLMMYRDEKKRDEGREEVALDIVGFVPLVSLSSIRTDDRSVPCIFEQGKFVKSCGSYIGDEPSLNFDRKPFSLSGTCDPFGFFAGEAEEKNGFSRQSYYSSSLHNQFVMVKLDQSLFTKEQMDDIAQYDENPKEMGPQRPLSFPIYCVFTSQHRYGGRVIGHPLAFIAPTDISARGLHEEVVARMTSRMKARLGQVKLENGVSNRDLVTEDDPYQLRGMFRIRQRSVQGTLDLDPNDDSSLMELIERGINPKCELMIEWDVSLAEESRFGEALFGNLYPDDPSNDDLKGTTRLYDCFDMFSEDERLTSTETWYCSNCKEHKEAFKKMELWQAPDVLVIHFKRFSQSQMSYYVDKDDTEVDFPLEGLDLRDRVRSSKGRDECIYDLVAVSHHYGGLGGGHYIAHARNETDGMWYEFDDSTVRFLGASSSAAASRVKGSSAYVLMYVKRSFTQMKWGDGANQVHTAPGANGLIMENGHDHKVDDHDDYNFSTAMDDGVV